jgi:chromosome segregation ATPase
MQSSIDNERWKRIQLSSENTITINNLKKMFDENTNIIKHQYEQALQSTPNSQNMSKLLHDQEKSLENKYNKILQELHENYKIKIVEQRMELEKTISTLRTEYSEKEVDLENKQKEIVVRTEQVTALKEMCKKREKANIIEIESIEQKYTKKMSEHLELCKEKLSSLNIKNTKLTNKIQEVLVKNANLHDKISNHNKQINLLELYYQKELNITKVQFNKYTDECNKEKLQLEDTVNDLNKDIQKMTFENIQLNQKLEELNDKYVVILKDNKILNKICNRIRKIDDKKR